MLCLQHLREEELDFNNLSKISKLGKEYQLKTLDTLGQFSSLITQV